MNLENRFFYRFVKVWRVTWLIIGIITTFIILSLKIPNHVPNNYTSYIVCDDNTKIKSYFGAIGIKIYSQDNEKLTTENSNKAEKFCSKNACHKDGKICWKTVTNPAILQQLKDLSPKIANQKNYKFRVSYFPRDWSGYPSFAWMVFAIFFGFYVVLNLFCETLLYLAFSKKISWRWIIFFIKTP